MKSSLFAMAALALASASSAASAASFLFSYQAGSGLLAGSLTGDLQADNNTVLISAFSNVSFEGTAAPELTFVNSFTNFAGGQALSPATSLDGALQDFITCTTGGCSLGFLLSTSQATVNSSEFFGGLFETYNPDNWSLTAVGGAVVPEPASWAMLIAGFGLIGASLRRRRHTAAHA